MRARSPLADLAVAGAVALSAAGVNVSCAGPTDDTLARVAIDTLAGGQVRVSNPDHGADPTLVDWWLEEELRIGVLQGESPELFGDVGSLTADRNGAIYIADFQSAEIRVFDADGGFLRRFGRRGEGPGEFRLLLRGMTLLWQHPDRLWIADAPHLSAFDSLGNLVGRVPHRIALSTHWSGQLDSAGFFYEEGVAQASGDSGMARRFIARFRASDDTNPVHTADTLGLPFVSRKTRLDRHDYGTQGILEVVELPMQPSVLWAWPSRGTCGWPIPLLTCFTKCRSRAIRYGPWSSEGVWRGWRGLSAIASPRHLASRLTSFRRTSSRSRACELRPTVGFGWNRFRLHQADGGTSSIPADSMWVSSMGPRASNHGRSTCLGPELCWE